MNLKLKKIIKALLLSTSEALTIDDLMNVFKLYQEQISKSELDTALSPSKKELLAVIDEIRQEAESESKAYRLIEGPKGLYISIAPEFSNYVRLMREEPKPSKLTSATLETLSIIAYRQPVTRPEIESIRGVTIDSPLNKLLEMELIQIAGRSELPGKPIQYGTTEKFLEYSGIRNLDDLPASDVLTNYQIENYLKDSKQNSITDETVGLPKESDPSELPLDETFVQIDSEKTDTNSVLD